VNGGGFALYMSTIRDVFFLCVKVLYLDSMDLGVWNMEPKIFPRIRCFSADRIRSLILADTLFPGDSYRLPEFGKSQVFLISPFSCSVFVLIIYYLEYGCFTNRYVIGA